MKRMIVVVLTIAVLLCSVAALAESQGEMPFSHWNVDAPSLKALIEYVEAVTDEASPDYIPPADRIATFDNDGTLMAELAPTYLEVMLLTERILADASWQPDAEMLEFGRMTRDHALDKSFPADYDYEFSKHQAKAFAGMTLTEYADFITRFLVREADGFEGMTYANAYYLPMAEVVEYLQDNGFKCFVVSGTDRFIVRTFIEGILDIPYENIIGSDTALEAKNQGGQDGIEYVYTSEDTLVRTDRFLIKDLKTNKVLQIAQEIGKQPVLSFGNSSGDVSMNNYALYNNRYRSAVFQLVADDDVRDYGDPEKGRQLREQWESMGYNVISMRDDWKTIYGEEVRKTGEFHWLQNYADDRIPATAETVTETEAETETATETTTEASTEAESETNADIQYVLYLGTNDKDTNAPVFTQAEALERLKDILIRNFGGYTIQEAYGGWIDGDKEYQEYTLVIYLSDTTIDKVHAAADEMIETFRQSSVLIQENPTKTEFYNPAE